MRTWKIIFTDASQNIALGDADIWSGKPGVSSVQYLGEVEAPVIPATPILLSKTAFQDYAVSQLGGGTTGMGRFTDIMDATENSASSAIRFAFARYTAAVIFEKTNTAALTTIMAADTTTNHLTTDEQTAILSNWPTA